MTSRDSYKKGFKVTVEGAESLSDKLKGFPERFEKNILIELNFLANKAEHYARKLAPRDTGRLEESINAGKSERVGMSYVVYVGTNVEYATYVHELNSKRLRGDKYDKGVKLENYYLGGMGAETRAKATIGGYMPGRKYMRNAVILTDKHVGTAVRRALRNAWEGK